MYLSRIGGMDVAKNICRVMKSCVTYSDASQYILLGQKNKKSFASHPVYQVIVRKYALTVLTLITFVLCTLKNYRTTFLIILSHKLVNAACIGSHAYAEESCCMWLNFLVTLSCCEIQT